MCMLWARETSKLAVRSREGGQESSHSAHAGLGAQLNVVDLHSVHQSPGFDSGPGRHRMGDR